MTPTSCPASEDTEAQGGEGGLSVGEGTKAHVGGQERVSHPAPRDGGC